MIAHDTGYGWLVYVPQQDIATFAPPRGSPEELVLIMELARTSGCPCIPFDCDAPITELLPTFHR
ncbi:hypothetical protein [Nocardia sp. NRRL S-836]|uniref:DUF5983 family protein n=1 Tax=Nocardia sp. NRRL S-836 TaxID=1519492 RepID=UPI0006AE11BD|nr:hypothetical protein [Nocardia sp. NRRL S-836]KOV84636.1 hypothetical protein ADL03_15180 [Nocardia sp. NRRL S-836]